jgi:hypothetical protein
VQRLIFLCFFLLAGQLSAFADPSYSKSADLPALRLSFTQLQSVLNKAASLMRSVNKTETIRREQLELRSQNFKVEISGYKLEPEGAKVPDAIDRFRYTAWTLEDSSAIGRIELDFDDHNRTLRVDGWSADHVDAVFSALKDDLSGMASSFGGAAFKSLGVVIVTASIPALVALCLVWLTSRKSMLLVPIGLLLAVVLAIFSMPLSELFAGFAAYRTDPSFMVRYGPSISLIGLIVSIVAIPLSFVPAIIKRSPDKVETSPKANSRKSK